jgi:hypothetical protein
MKTKSKDKVKKISQGHYTYKGLHIVLCYGERENYWNIWKNEGLTQEWEVGINTKWQCIEGIDKYYK